jgi:hypothetical protein
LKIARVAVLGLGLGLLLSGAGAVLGGCKEGVGDRCLVDKDCASGLVCNQAQMVCAEPGTSGGIDATIGPPMDASVPVPDASAAAP